MCYPLGADGSHLALFRQAPKCGRQQQLNHRYCSSVSRQNSMFITEQEAEERLSRRENALARFKRVDIREAGLVDTPARPGTPRPLTQQDVEDYATGKQTLVQKNPITFEQAVLIGAAAKSYGNDATGNLFGLNPSTVSQISNGKMPGRAVVDEELVEAIVRQQRVIRDISYDKLMSVLNLFTPEKIEQLGKKDAKDITAVAQRLASIFKDATPKTEDKGNKAGAVFHIYQPGQKNIGEYKQVVVNSAQPTEPPTQGYIDGSTV